MANVEGERGEMFQSLKGILASLNGTLPEAILYSCTAVSIPERDFSKFKLRKAEPLQYEVFKVRSR